MRSRKLFEIPNNITTIALDLGGVLFEELTLNFAFKRIERDFGIKEHDLENLLKPKYNSFYVSDITENQFWSDVVETYQLPLSVFKQYYRETVAIVPFVYVEIKSLSKQFKVISLNNEPKEWMDFRIKQFNLNSIFDSYVCSGYLGYQKPEDKIFTKFIEVADEIPQNIYYIDNSENNLMVAEKFGFNTHLFQTIYPPLD